MEIKELILVLALISLLVITSVVAHSMDYNDRTIDREWFKEMSEMHNLMGKMYNGMMHSDGTFMGCM